MPDAAGGQVRILLSYDDLDAVLTALAVAQHEILRCPPADRNAADDSDLDVYARLSESLQAVADEHMVRTSIDDIMSGVYGLLKNHRPLS